jgi:hypothetical protein
MVRVARKRRLVNPARRRRKLSAKQIKFFGTPAQKAALRRKRSSAATGHRRRNTAKKHRRKNVGEIIIAGLNPASIERSTRKMKKTKKRRKNRSAAASAPKRRRRYNVARKNPATAPRRRRRHRNSGSSHRRRTRRYSNPNSRAMNLFEMGAWGVGGMIGSRALPQVVLGAKNTGWLGYLANGIAALGLGWGVKKFVHKEAGDMVMIGGIGGLILRVIADNTTVGKALASQLQGVGDVGVYGAATFFTPLAEAGNGDRGALSLPSAVDRPSMPAAPAGAAGVGRTGGSRYTSGSRFN